VQLLSRRASLPHGRHVTCVCTDHTPWRLSGWAGCCSAGPCPVCAAHLFLIKTHAFPISTRACFLANTPTRCTHIHIAVAGPCPVCAAHPFFTNTHVFIYVQHTYLSYQQTGKICLQTHPPKAHAHSSVCCSAGPCPMCVLHILFVASDTHNLLVKSLIYPINTQAILLANTLQVHTQELLLQCWPLPCMRCIPFRLRTHLHTHACTHDQLRSPFSQGSHAQLGGPT
jgi:hypothetical protein